MEQGKTLELGAEREDWRNHLKTFEREAIEGGWGVEDVYYRRMQVASCIFSFSLPLTIVFCCLNQEGLQFLKTDF